MSVDSKLLQKVYLQTGQIYAKYFLDFAHQYRYDFLALRTEWANLLQAVDIIIEQEDFSLLGKGLAVLNHLAEIEEARGNYDGARELYEKQIQVCDRLNIKGQDLLTIAFRTIAFRQLVKIMKRQENNNQAQIFLEYWLNVVREQQNASEQVDILLQLSEIYQKKNEFEQADLFCQEGLKIAQNLGYRLGLVEALKQRASIQLAQRHYQYAKELYQMALKEVLGIRDQIGAREIKKQLETLERTMRRGIFISYTHNDRGFVKHLAGDLKTAGLSVWWDEWEIKVGDSIIQKVSEGINQSAYLIVVLSPHSVQSSWVQRELGSALMRQLSKERKITVLPLKIAECKVPILLNEIKWANFIEGYQTGLSELLDALE